MRFLPSHATKLLLATTLALIAAAAPASAFVPAELVVQSGRGLTVPSGAVVTPDGALWIADGEKGVCRVRTTPNAGLVGDAVWCDVNDPALDKTGQMAFDADTNTFYVGEADSAAGGVWRLHWNPATGTISSGGKIVDTPDDLVTGLAITYTGPPAYDGGPATAEVNFTSKRTNSVRRVRAPQSPQPEAITVGFRRFAGEEEVGSLAALGADLYLAEPFGVTKLSTVPGETPRAELLPGLGGGFPAGIPSAVVADPVRNRIYAGTSNGNVQDQVDVLDLTANRHETYALGVAGVMALALEADGDVIVVDDPRDAADADVNDGARVWRLPLAPLARPSVSFTTAPPTFVAARSVHFAYAARPDSMFECWLDDAPLGLCGGPGGAERSFHDLAEGTHTFAVRALDPDPEVGAGPIARRTFVLDVTPPVVRIQNAIADAQVQTNDFTVRFSGNEPNLVYDCSVDDGAPESCSPSTHTFRGLDHGPHTVRVSATDYAGNVSAAGVASTFDIYVHAPSPPKPPADSGYEDVPAAIVAGATEAAPAPAPKARAPIARGEAWLSRHGRPCARGGFEARVRGTSIDRVGFRLDGRRVAIVRKADRKRGFRVRLPRASGDGHDLRALVRFVKGAGGSERLALAYRCRSAR